VPITRARKPAKRKTRLDESWRPSADVLARMQARYPTVDLEAEFEKFQNSHIGRGTEWVDWNRALWLWLGRIPDFATNGSGGIDAKGRDWQASKTRDGTDGKCDIWNEFGLQRTALREAEHALAAQQPTLELEARKDSA
jgi:hypothetical protein